MSDDAGAQSRQRASEAASRNGDGGYVHDPDAFDGDGERRDAHTTKAYVEEAPEVETFGPKGWALVAALAFAFVVVPATLLYLPQMEPFVRSLGLTFRDAYLVLPLLPALVLGALAVWVAVSGLGD